MIVKTQAIALRVAPYSESSCLVLWMTPDQGKIMTLIKGAWRRRSLFLGQVDVLYTCELLYDWRLNEELHVA